MSAVPFSPRQRQQPSSATCSNETLSLSIPPATPNKTPAHPNPEGSKPPQVPKSARSATTPSKPPPTPAPAPPPAATPDAAPPFHSLTEIPILAHDRLPQLNSW